MNVDGGDFEDEAFGTELIQEIETNRGKQDCRSAREGSDVADSRRAEQQDKNHP